MYKFLIRPILFQISPESVHHLVVSIIKLLFKIPLIGNLFKLFYCVKNESLNTEVCGLKFKNPVGLAAGFDKNATFFNEFSSFGFGFIEIGTATPKGQPGNPKPRSFRLKADEALINRMGFNNKGVQDIVANLKRRKTDLIIGGNIGKNTATPNDEAVTDYLECFNVLYNYVDYFVVNVSCPNVSNLAKLQDQDSLDAILAALMKARQTKKLTKPVFLKISPDLNWKQVDESLTIVSKNKIDGLVISNTTVTRDGLNTPAEKIRQIGNGGLSGKPIRERSTEMIRYVYRKTNGNLPIIGVGGIMTPSDALEKLNAGACLVQVYTGLIYEGPGIVKRINKHILKHRKSS